MVITVPKYIQLLIEITAISMLFRDMKVKLK